MQTNTSAGKRLREEEENKKDDGNSKLPKTEAHDRGGKKVVRVWADGCFDMMHFGHANALRQVGNGSEDC